MSHEFNVLRALANTLAAKYQVPTDTVIKELLHLDILSVLNKGNYFDRLTFQGGTAIRLCYHGKRLSEDLDFTAGQDFSLSCFDSLADEFTTFFQNRYQLPVTVKSPKQRNHDGVQVNAWQVRINIEPEDRQIPNQMIKVEVANVRSLTRLNGEIQDHYGLATKQRRQVIVQSAEELVADKIIAVAARPYFKARDLFDLKFWQDRQVTHRIEHVVEKLTDYQIDYDTFVDKLSRYTDSLSDLAIKDQFINEMKRFCDPKLLKVIEHPQFWSVMSSQMQQYLNASILNITRYVENGERPDEEASLPNFRF